MSWEDRRPEFTELTEEEAQAFIPDMLYKYRDWNNPYHQSILSNRQVYFSAAEEFDDPHDCRFPVDFDFSYPTAEEFFFHNVRVVHRRPWSDDQIKAMARYHYREGFGTPEKQAAKRKAFYDIFNGRHGVLCLCKSGAVSSMWDEYANKFDGFCVGISLSNHLAYLSRNRIFGSDVTYVSPSFPPLKYVMAHKATSEETASFFMRLIETKYENFKNEDEYRLVKLFEGAFLDKVHKQERLVELPQAAYNEVIFGYRMNKYAIRQIIDTCDAQGLKVNYKVASPDGKGGVLIEPYTP